MVTTTSWRSPASTMARKLLGKDMNIVFHSHDTAGVCIQQYVSALDAGANQVDLSMSPVSGGTCQPDIITMWHALRHTDAEVVVGVPEGDRKSVV